MKKNSVFRSGKKIIRVLEITEGECLVIDCQKRTMPYWSARSDIEGMEEVSFEWDSVELDEEEKRVMHQRFTMISSVLPVVTD